MKRKVLGVIGGVGPLSTAYFMEVVIRMTDVQTDQEHIDMVVLNHTEIPDRTDYILDSSKPNPVPLMLSDARRLEELGADIIVTPCNTAHYFYHELSSAVSVPFLNMIDETAAELSRMGTRKAGVLATNGTVHTGLFQEALEKRGIEAVLPSPDGQRNVMEIIYQNVKAGVPSDREKWNAITLEMEESGCDHVILGCTELSLLRREFSLGRYFVDALEVLAARSIEACGKPVRR